MVGEYWAPKEDWHVYEFLAGSMTIIEEVPGPKDGINGLSKKLPKNKISVDSHPRSHIMQIAASTVQRRRYTPMLLSCFQGTVSPTERLVVFTSRLLPNKAPCALIPSAPSTRDVPGKSDELRKRLPE
jgi:hypothetical protein